MQTINIPRSTLLVTNMPPVNNNINILEYNQTLAGIPGNCVEMSSLKLIEYVLSIVPKMTFLHNSLAYLLQYGYIQVFSYCYSLVEYLFSQTLNVAC